jgi:hypothetical protein
MFGEAMGAELAANLLILVFTVTKPLDTQEDAGI